MLISASKKFIFIHVYKTAGTSIQKSLQDYCLPPKLITHPIKRLKYEANHFSVPKSDNFRGHISASELRKRLPSSVFENFFKFAFVRNPWDWQVSLYHYAKQSPTHHQHELVNKLGSFESYIHWRVNNDCHLQREYLFENDRCLVDFIGKMENLQTDMATICEKLQIPKLSLPHTNKSKRKHYSEYYNQRTRQLLAKYFAEDIETFQYTFEEQTNE